MNTHTIVVGLIALVLGGAGGYVLNDQSSAALVPNKSMQGEMDGMMQALAGKSGDAFDRVFLSEMIMHHEGAVLMAEAALQNAEHAEIKEMANDIIAAQTSEINQMQEWQQTWYANESPVHHAQ